MSDIKVYTVESERTEGLFSYATKWKYMIKTGSRCNGLLSIKQYKSYESALNAGERMATKLMKGAK